MAKRPRRNLVAIMERKSDRQTAGCNKLAMRASLPLQLTPPSSRCCDDHLNPASARRALSAGKCAAGIATLETLETLYNHLNVFKIYFMGVWWPFIERALDVCGPAFDLRFSAGRSQTRSRGRTSTSLGHLPNRGRLTASQRPRPAGFVVRGIPWRVLSQRNPEARRVRLLRSGRLGA